MKKIQLLLVLILIVTMVLSLSVFISCKSTAETTVAETTAAETTAAQEIYKVRVGAAPYAMYFIWAAAHGLGLDAKFGVDLEVNNFASPTQGTEAMVRGDLDLTSSGITDHLSVIKGAPEVKFFSTLGFFQGYFFVGRVGEIKPWVELKEEMGGDLAKAKEFRLNEFKGKTFCVIALKKDLVLDTVGQIGLTEKDITIKIFADDQKAATAFLSGEGDFYTGSLPQQTNLVKMTDKFVDAGGGEILGPAGLWYDTMASTDKFMKDNHEAALRTLATLYASINFFDKDPQAFAEVAAAKLSEATGSPFTVDEYIEFQTKYDDFLSIEQANEGFYNKDSDFYWKLPAEYTLKGMVAQGVLDSSTKLEDYYSDGENLFKELQERADLMELIEAEK